MSEFVPAASRAIPRSAGELAEALARTNRSLRAAIGRWVAGGEPSPPRPPGDVVLLSLYQQRIYRLLARDDVLARRTLPLLPPGVAGPAAANIGAARELFTLISPVRTGFVLHVQRPAPPGRLLGFFHEAERRFGVDWQLLAAVMLVESKFGRTRSASTAGAQGPMQFVPSTWAAYGLGGDVHDPHDAILGAANYLHASGAPQAERRALFAYNHAAAYVDAVETYADEMRRDPRAYFAYYNWQVFLVTVAGDRRLTGPGRS
ncbi:MAG: transglycosylase SLT domain-containing protein [Actinomycetota bacterium]